MTNDTMRFLDGISTLNDKGRNALLTEMVKNAENTTCQTPDYKAALEQSHGVMVNWGGDIGELHALLCAAQRYTEDGNTIPAGKVIELDAIIGVVARSLEVLEEEMDEHTNEIVNLCNITEI